MSGRILIADDEDSLRWVLEKGFRGAGYEVTADAHVTGCGRSRSNQAHPMSACAKRPRRRVISSTGAD